MQINTKCAAVDCRWVLYGFLGGSKVQEFDLKSLFSKRIQLLTTALKSRSDQYKADLIKEVGAVLFPEDGPKLQAVVDKEFPMSQATQAHTYMESNASIGKILLKYDLN